MKLNNGDIRGRRVSNYSELEKECDFYFEFENGIPITFTFIIPDGTKRVEKIYLLPGGWKVEGTLNTPSIFPSIWIEPNKNGWHGTVTEGTFHRV